MVARRSVMNAEALAIFGQFGPMGLMVAYLIWEKRANSEKEKERTEADKAIAAALSALTVTIQLKLGGGSGEQR